jgi:hypothetical protein
VQILPVTGGWIPDGQFAPARVTEDDSPVAAVEDPRTAGIGLQVREGRSRRDWDE